MSTWNIYLGYASTFSSFAFILQSAREFINQTAEYLTKFGTEFYFNHCVVVFKVFLVNTQSEWGKIRSKKTPYAKTFHTVNKIHTLMVSTFQI